MSFDIGPNFYLVSPDIVVLGSAQLQILILDGRVLFIGLFHCVELFNRFKHRHACVCLYLCMQVWACASWSMKCCIIDLKCIMSVRRHCCQLFHSVIWNILVILLHHWERLETVSSEAEETKHCMCYWNSCKPLL